MSPGSSAFGANGPDEAVRANVCSSMCWGTFAVTPTVALHRLDVSLVMHMQPLVSSSSSWLSAATADVFAGVSGSVGVVKPVPWPLLMCG